MWGPVTRSGHRAIGSSDHRLISLSATLKKAFRSQNDHSERSDDPISR
jgi:hypothetical protein